LQNEDATEAKATSQAAVVSF